MGTDLLFLFWTARVVSDVETQQFQQGAKLLWCDTSCYFRHHPYQTDPMYQFDEELKPIVLKKSEANLMLFFYLSIDNGKIRE